MAIRFKVYIISVIGICCGQRSVQKWHDTQYQGVLLRNTISLKPASTIAKMRRGEWSISSPEGHEPPHVPHCRQSRNASPPGVFAITSSKKVWGEEGRPLSKTITNTPNPML
jgi:hypothetical protein